MCHAQGLWSSVRFLNSYRKFIAINGKRFNGAEFIGEALQKGANIIILDEDEAAGLLQAKVEGLGVRVVTERQDAHATGPA